MGWWGGIRQKWYVIESGGLRVSECSKHSIFMLFIKENWICTMAGHHIEPNINILLIRYLPFDSNVIQWSHLLTMALYYLWSKPNNRTRSQFECDVTCFCFCFDFIHSHVWYGCCSIVCLRFQVLQIKQAYSKASSKNVNNYK